MAVLVATRIVKGSQVDVDQLSQRVEEAIAQQGAPPMGLMVHIAHPAGDGFVIQDVWRTEAEMRSYYDSVVLPALTATGLTHEEPCRSCLVVRTSVTAAPGRGRYSFDPYRRGNQSRDMAGAVGPLFAAQVIVSRQFLTTASVHTRAKMCSTVCSTVWSEVSSQRPIRGV